MSGQMKGGQRPPTTVVRQRWSAGAARDWDRLWPRWGLDLGQARDWRPQVLDIGVGDGHSTMALAERYPDHRVLAVELYRPGLVNLMRSLEAGEGRAVRLLNEDVRDLFELLSPASLVEVAVLFPDPWPKRRHRDRRLLAAPLTDRLAELLVPGGVLHLATDLDDYARSAALAIEAAGLEPCPPPPRPDTGFARRARRAGRSSVDRAWRRPG